MDRLKTVLLWAGLFLAIFYRVELTSFVLPYYSEAQKSVMRLINGPDLVFPNRQNELRAFSVVPAQWGNDDFRYVLVVEDNTPVMYKPNLLVKPREHLDISKRVCVLFKMKGWAFVGEPDYSEAIGWVEIESLGFRHNFSPVSRWEFGDFRFFKEGYKAEYKVKENGSFQLSWKASGAGLLLKGTTKGQFLGYKDVFFAKKDVSNMWEDFFFSDEMEYFYPEIMANPDRRAI